MSSKKKAAEGSSKMGLARWLGAPARALSRACDSYVRRMSACAGRMPTPVGTYYGYGGGRAPGAMQAATFSSRSGRRRGDDEAINELLRAMSLRHQQAAGRGGGEDVVAATVPVPVRSRSVAVGRIDEDAPCEFGADVDVVLVGAVRRTRSVAVGSAAYKPGAGFVVRG